MHRFLFVLLLVSALSFVSAQEPRPQGAEWSKVRVEEAFISRRTSIEYRDTFSAAEFGWRLMLKGSVLGRGALYPTLYAPMTLNQKLRMELIERDVFADDLVAGFWLKPGAGRNKYIITKNEDFGIITRSPFYPDADSGADFKASGAGSLQKNHFVKGSVSFLKRDYTDHFRLPKGETSVLVVYSGTLYLKLLEENYRLIKGGSGSFRTYVILNGKRKDLIRLRGKAGRGAVKYRLFLAQGPERKLKLRNAYLAELLVKSPGSSAVDFRAFANAMNLYDSVGSLKACRGFLKGRAPERIPCAFYLYTFGTERDFQTLEKKYPRESRKYKDALRLLREKILKQRKSVKTPEA